MKSFLLIPLIVIIAAAAGYGVCRAGGLNFSPRQLCICAAICTVAAMAALIPATLAKEGGMTAVSQASLLGTIIHMFLTVLLSAVAWLAKVTGEQKPFLFWLLLFYWVSLLALVAGLVRIVRRIAPPPAGQPEVTGPVAAPGRH